MRVVVTGASGFIGRNVLLRAPREWTITAVAHRSPDLEAFVDEHRLSHVHVVRCDLTDADAVRAAAAPPAAPMPRCTSPRTAIPRLRPTGRAGTSSRTPWHR